MVAQHEGEMSLPAPPPFRAIELGVGALRHRATDCSRQAERLRTSRNFDLAELYDSIAEDFRQARRELQDWLDLCNKG